MNNPNEEKPYEKLKFLEEALEIAENSGNISEIFQNLSRLAELCQEIKANDLGLNFVQKAIDLSKKYSTSEEFHEFYKYLGDFKFELGLLEEAKEAYNISIKKAGKKKVYQTIAENHLD